MASLNKVQIIGNAGKDPEIRTSEKTGNKIASFSVATSETWTDKTTGEKKETTEWHRITVFNQNLVGIIEQYVKKGSKLYLSGKLKTRKYTDNNGVERYTTEIVLGAFDGEILLLDGKDKSGSTMPPPPEASDFDDKTTGAAYQRAKDGWDTPTPAGDFNDEIPF